MSNLWTDGETRRTGPVCGFRSSVSDATCVLPAGHAAASADRFHKYAQRKGVASQHEGAGVTDGWVLAGEVPVDSGTVLVSDPAYAEGLSCSRLFHRWDRNVDDRSVVSLHDHGYRGALLVQRFGGDGTYPLYVKRGEDGLVRAVMIDFDDTLGVYPEDAPDADE